MKYIFIILILSLNVFSEEIDFAMIKNHFLHPIEKKDVDHVGNKIINRRNNDKLSIHCLKRLNEICLTGSILLESNKEFFLLKTYTDELITIDLTSIEKIKNEIEKDSRSIKTFNRYNHVPFEHTAVAVQGTIESGIIILLVPIALVLDTIKLPIDFTVHSSNFFTKPLIKLRAKRVVKTLIGEKKNKKVSNRFFEYLTKSFIDFNI